MATTRRKEMPEAMPAPPYVPPVRLTRKQLVAKFQDKVTEALAGQVEAFEPKQMLVTIVNDLEKQKQAVVLRLLGLDSRWGKYEVDHCNGRKSDISETVAAHCKPVIDKWIINAIEPILLELKGKVAAQVKTALRTEIDSIMSYRIREHASRVAGELLQELAETAKKEISDVE